MRNFKATLLLGGITSALVFVLTLGGWLTPLDAAWKGLLHVTPNDPMATDMFQGIMIFFFAFATIGVGITVHRRQARLLLLFLTAFLLVSGSLVLALYHIFLNPIPAEIVLFLGYGMVLIFIRTPSGARQPLLRQLFGERLPRPAFKKLVDGKMSLEFLGELHHGSILICSLNNQGELMESLSPQAYVEMTNLYLQTASDFLVDVGGYLDECSGEGISVVFGIPFPVEGPMNHGEKATRAALDLAIRLDELNRNCDARWQKRLDFRIGIHSGEMIAAIYGGTRLSHYSVSGPVVDFARYLCAACTNYGSRILVGPSTYEMAEATVEFRPIDLLQRKGVRRRVELYEALAPKHTLSAERERSRDFFWKGVIFFRAQEWDKAVAAFTAARILGISDKGLDLYLERIDRAHRGMDQLSPEQAILTEALPLVSNGSS